MFVPSTSTSPLSGVIIAPMIEIRLVLPLPDGPDMTVSRPEERLNEIVFRTSEVSAPVPKPNVTSHISTLCTKDPPGIDAHGWANSNQRSQDAEQEQGRADKKV